MKKENSVRQKASRLRERLSQEDKVLIIMDDIWEKIDLEKLGIPLDNNHPNIKILLTTRNEQVIKSKMESEHNFHLKPLKSCEAVDLFKQIVGDQVVNESTLIEQLAEECLGLPVLISPLASSLKSLPSSAWANVLTKIKQSKSLGIEKFIDKSLEFNYHLIKSDEAKSLFLLCGRIGSQIISTNHILIYGMGLGLLKDVRTMEEAREKVKLLLDNLKASCLLEDSGEGFSKLHDLMGDAALSIVSNAHDSLVIRDRKTLKACDDGDLRGCKFMSLHLDEGLLERLNCPALEMLLVGAKEYITDPEIPDAFFKDLRELKVLSISNMGIYSLPSSIQFLSKLHTLCLDRVNNDVTIIGKLKTLQVLNLGRSNIIRIRREIGELYNLRHLNLSGCQYLRVIEPGVLGRFIHLEEMLLPLHFDYWDVEGISNASLTELNNMPNLSTLVICVPDAESLALLLPLQQLVRHNIEIKQGWDMPDSGESRTLKLEFDPSNGELISKEWLQTVLKKTQDLCLHGWIGIPTTVTKLSKEGFLELKHLYVQNCPSIKYMIRSEQPNLIPVIESLSLRGLINLQKICKGDLPLNCLRNLKSIKVEACDNLRNLFSFPLVKDILPMLEKVEVTDCIMMKGIITYGKGREGDKVEMLELKRLHSLKLVNLQNISSFCSEVSREIVDNDGNTPFEFLDGRQISLPCLESLTLCELPKLRKISHGQYPVKLDGLKSLELSKCESLSYAMDSNSLQLLRNLETLVIEDCQQMETVFHMEELNTPEAIRNHSVQIHLKLSRLPMLKKLWNQHPQKIPFVPGMKKLEVSECDGLENLFASYMANSISNISRISIASCMAMKEIFLEEETDDPGIQFTSLSHLSISKMENLTMFSGGNHHYRFPCLMQLEISECPKMRTFVPMNHEKEELSSEDANKDGSFFNPKVIFPRLEKLVLHSLESMMSIWDDNNLSKDSFCMLASIEIENCARIQSIFYSHLVERLQKLEKVKIESCESLEAFFKHAHGKLKSPSINEAALGFPSLREVFVRNCCRLIKLFPNGTARTLSKLADIYISSCEGLVEVISCDDDDEGNMVLIETMKFYNLTSLQLENLASLVHFCSGHYKLYFPYLKKLSIIGCMKLTAFMTRPSNFVGPGVRLQEISSTSNYTGVDFSPLFDEKVAFPNLEDLEAKGLLVKEIWPKRKPAGFLTELKKLQVEDCHQLSIIFPSLVLRNLSRLESLSVKSCMSVEVVFQLESYSSTRKKLLRSKSTTKIMEHLREITVSSCKSLKYIVAMREDDYIGETYHKTVVFPRLSSLNLSQLSRLGSFCPKNHQIELPSLEKLIIKDCQAVDVLVADSNQDCKPLLLVKKESWHVGKEGPHSECSSQAFCKLKVLRIEECNSLLAVFPSKMIRAFHNLNRLSVKRCESLESVFEFSSLRSGTEPESDTFDDVVPTAFALRWLELKHLPRMKHVWDAEDPRWSNLFFENLYGVSIEGCDGLRHLFPASVAGCLRQLNWLEVMECEGMEGIVWNKESFYHHQFTSATPSLEPNSYAFGIHSLEWPSIAYLDLSSSPKAKVFASAQQKISMPSLTEIHIDASTQESRQFLEEIYDNPVWLVLKNVENQQNIPWSFLLERFPHIQTLQICEKEGGEAWYITRILDVAERLEISNNCHRLTILAPSSPLFHNLIVLRLDGCKGLSPYLVTSSVARDLVQLVELSVSGCANLEEIVTYDNDSDEEDGKYRAKDGDDDDDANTISFPRLKSLELLKSPSLRSFSSTRYKFNFPSLMYVEMDQLPKMYVFCEGGFYSPYKHRIIRNVRALYKGEVECCSINPGCRIGRKWY